MDSNAKVVGKIQPQEQRITFIWTIEDFCSIRKQYSVGKHILSPTFVSFQSETHFELYPQGVTVDDKGHITIFIVKHTVPGLIAHVMYSIMDTTLVFIRKTNDNDEVVQFIPFEEIEKVLSENNNKLIIKCEIILNEDSYLPVYKNEVEQYYQVQECCNFERLLDDNVSSDVTLSAGGKQFYVHKNILSMKSDVFFETFKNNIIGKQQEIVNIEGIAPNVFQEMLRYIYIGRVDGIAKMAEDLLSAANKYKLTGLKNLCEETLCENLTISNAIKYFNLGQNCNAEQLKAQAKQYIASNAEAIIDIPEFESMAKLEPSLICEIFHESIAQRAKKEQNNE